MKAYVGTTAVIFGLFTILHAWKAIAEGQLINPHFILLTVLTVSMFVWSLWVLRRSSVVPRE